ncbi:MAG: hypothetical protein AABP62_00010 [Planctomycetota bacterium]
MSIVIGTVHEGRVHCDEVVEWPEGTRLRIEPLPPTEVVGLRDEDWPCDPAGIQALLARMDTIQPLVTTPEDEANWLSALRDQRVLEAAGTDRRAEQLQGNWP